MLAVLVVAAWAPALADDVADERARIANQRIQAEEARRARDEAERLNQAASEQATDVQAASTQEIPRQSASQTTPPASKDVATEVSAERMEMSLALQQLRELGALRDAGHVTEQEFERLKKKILDATL